MFNKPGRSCGCNQIKKKELKKKQERKYARRETHKDVTKISEYQKLKTKKRQKNNNKRSEKL